MRYPLADNISVYYCDKHNVFCGCCPLYTRGNPPDYKSLFYCEKMSLWLVVDL